MKMPDAYIISIATTYQDKENMTVQFAERIHIKLSNIRRIFWNRLVQ